MRDPKKIPKNPHTKCSNPECDKWINIKRSKLINSKNFQKFPNLKNVRKKFPNMKIVKNLEILRLLDKGLYAQEISQKYSLSASFLSRIINSFESRNLIEQYQSYPKRYKLTKIGKLILAQGDLNQKRIQEFTNGKEDSPKWIDKLRVHKLRFKNKIIQKPSWLDRIRDTGIINGLTIKRIELKNWTKYLLSFNYQDFNGLEKIEVCNYIIIYNFNQKIEEQYVSSKEGLEKYITARIEDCKKVREFIEQKGFVIDNAEPTFCQKPHFAIETKGDQRTLGSLGPLVNITIKNSHELREFDDSPGKGEGEEETDDKEKAKSMFDVPQKIDDLKSEINDLKQAMIGMANGIKEMTKVFSSLAKQQEPPIKIKTDSGGMFQ